MSELPTAALDAFLSVVGPDTTSTLLTTEIRHLGGALGPGVVDGGALSGIDAEFAVYSGTITPDATSVGDAHATLDHLERTMAPWTADTAYSNFAESPESGDRLFGRDVHRTLRQVKANYDPIDLFRANHPVAPATAG